MNICGIGLHRWSNHATLTRRWRECSRCNKAEVFRPTENGKTWTYYQEQGK